MVPTGKGNLAPFGHTLGRKPSHLHNTSALVHIKTATSSSKLRHPRSYSSPNLQEVTFIFTKDYFGPMQKHPPP